MNKYRVNVNGNLYEIEIEDISGTAPAQPAPAAPAQKAQPAPASSAPAGGRNVTSPMPGTVLSIKVSPGQAVKRGQVLLILEAMKMENEIVAPCDGTVSSISVTEGASVTSGATLCAIS